MNNLESFINSLGSISSTVWVPIMVAVLTSGFSYFQSSKNTDKKILINREQIEAELCRLKLDDALQQKRANREFMAKLTFDKLTKFLEIAPLAARETGIASIIEIETFIHENNTFTDTDRLKQLESYKEITRNIWKRGEEFSVYRAQIQDLIIYASDNNRDKYNTAMSELSQFNFELSNLFLEGEFELISQKLSLNIPFKKEQKVINAIDDIRQELNSLIKQFRS